MKYDVIIVGGGISGFMTAKHLVDEGINNILILEKNKYPFGIWDRRNPHSCLKSTVTVSSKLYMSISDFPMDEYHADFLPCDFVLDYYEKYANHFKLFPYLKTNVDVIKISKKNNIWYIDAKSLRYVANNIVIASGSNNDCLNIPSESYYENFTGDMYHADQIKQIRHKLYNKNILTVGLSDTASDIAMLLYRENKVTMSTRRGKWFQQRGNVYNAYDTFYSRTMDKYLKCIHGKTNVTKAIGVEFLMSKGGSGVDIWQPKCNYLNSIYVKSRDVIDEVIKGNIIPKKRIVDINDKMIKFEGDKKEHRFDTIIFCTGYKGNNCFGFLERKYIGDRYLHIFVPGDSSIFFIGFVRPYLTSIPMLVELQSRYIAKVIAKKVKLPTKNQMLELIKEGKMKQIIEFPCDYKRVPFIVDPYDYSNTIANKIGAMPNFTKLFKEDISLWYIAMFRSWNHHVYRLNDKREYAIEQLKKVEYGHTHMGLGMLIVHIILWNKDRILALIILIIMYNVIINKK
jgi:thioredoxin reductase